MMKNKITAIFFSDIHLTEKPPRSRTDDFFQSQISKLDFISDLQKENECPVFCGGDFFDNWSNVSFDYFNKISKHIPSQLVLIAGQHDLPRHRLKYIRKTPLWALYQAHKAIVLHSNWYTNEFGSYGVFGINWEEDIAKEIPPPPIHVASKILLIHKTLWHKEKPYPGTSDSGNAQAFIDKYGGGFDLIISGDNHTPFALNHRGTKLVNCGSATRMKCNETHTPCCYAYDGENNSISKIELPCIRNPFDISKKEHEEDQENILQEFVETLKNASIKTLSFENNLDLFLKVNPQTDAVNDIIRKVS